MEPAYIFLLCIGASFIQRTTGFGFGIFIMTMLPFLMPSYGEATALSGLLALTTSLITMVKMRKYIVWRRLWPILLTFIAISGIAIGVLARMHDNHLRLYLGGILILVSLYFIFFSAKIKISPTPGSQVGAGALSGVMGGFFGMQGPPAVLYFISSEPDKEHYMGIVSAYFFIGNAAMTLFRAGNGFLTQTVALDYAACLPAVAIGSLLGGYAFSHLSGKMFKNIVYGYIGISGAIILLTSL